MKLVLLLLLVLGSVAIVVTLSKEEHYGNMYCSLDKDEGYTFSSRRMVRAPELDTACKEKP